MTNMTGVDAYPLCWPAGRPRTQYPRPSRFEANFGRARDSLIHEIKLLGGENAILSTNIPLRRDGLPLANYKVPADKGVAVYFTYKDRQMCFACDAWDKIEDNMQAVWKTIEALRGIARWGTGDMMERTFTGFEALPAPGQHAKRPWWQILGVNQHATPEEIKAAYHRQAMACHPDHGGNEALMAEVNAAYSEATRAA
jgi:DnaJ-like protein